MTRKLFWSAEYLKWIFWLHCEIPTHLFNEPEPSSQINYIAFAPLFLVFFLLLVSVLLSGTTFSINLPRDFFSLSPRRFCLDIANVYWYASWLSQRLGHDRASLKKWINKMLVNETRTKETRVRTILPNKQSEQKIFRFLYTRCFLFHFHVFFFFKRKLRVSSGTCKTCHTQMERIYQGMEIWKFNVNSNFLVCRLRTMFIFER